MKKVTGIVGSPKKKGKVDLLVSSVVKGAETAGAETQVFYLNDMRITPCQSCGVDPSPEYCLFSDDMQAIYPALTESDIVVLGSPVYFDTVSAQTKLLIDRCNCLMPYVRKSDGTCEFVRRVEKRKKGVFIASAGSGQEFDTILVTVRGFFFWVNAELVETMLYAHEHDTLGGVSASALAHASTVGRHLATEEPI